MAGACAEETLYKTPRYIPLPANLNEQLYFGEFDGLNKLPGGSVKPDHNNKWSYLEAAGQKDDKDIYIVIYITDRDWPLITFDAIEVKGYLPRATLFLMESILTLVSPQSNRNRKWP